VEELANFLWRIDGLALVWGKSQYVLKFVSTQPVFQIGIGNHLCSLNINFRSGQYWFSREQVRGDGQVKDLFAKYSQAICITVFFIQRSPRKSERFVGVNIEEKVVVPVDLGERWHIGHDGQLAVDGPEGT